MFTKLLIANRGEIACRVIRTARRLGIHTVAVYSDADSSALHVSMADEALHIGASPPRDSYLRGDRIVAAVERSGADAVHPGYGFLSENAEFAALCRDRGVVFVGPPVAAIEAMGSKAAAKSIMEKARIPLVPGYHGKDQQDDRLRMAASEIGYPVLLKAATGGGGKGMRIVATAAELDDALAGARREALSSFGDDAMLVEKYLTHPRHVEFQIFCDQHGNAVHLFERDCSVQRRHQKVMEEAPAPGLTARLRQTMGEAAVQAARAIDYEGAGTVEFLLDADESFYFMEMNTRLQVEHPVTEMITGQDLVEWQLRVAAGERLPLAQDELGIHGHAFEARVYAEDPAHDFLPVSGTLTFLQPPESSRHVRVDTGVRQGDEISPYYDPMIAKLIVWDETRTRALARLSRALTEYRISGTITNLEFLYNLATSKPFADADLDTGFIDRHRALLFREETRDVTNYLHLGSLYLLLRREQLAQNRANTRDPWSPWNATNAWRLNEANLNTGGIVLNGTYYDVPAEQIGFGDNRRFRISACGQEVIATGELHGHELRYDIDGYRSRAVVVAHGNRFSLFADDGAVQFALPEPDLGDEDYADNRGDLSAPMNGTIVSVLVGAGDRVARGQKLIVMEAMKMEHSISAPHDGVIDEVYCKPGELIDGGAQLVSISAAG